MSRYCGVWMPSIFVLAECIWLKYDFMVEPIRVWSYFSRILFSIFEHIAQRLSRKIVERGPLNRTP